MTSYILDTGAWIEYLKGTSRGARVQKLIEAKDTRLTTSESTIAELFAWSQAHNFSFPDTVNAITQQSQLQEVHLPMWIEAMRIRAEHRKKRPKFGIMDAIVAAIGHVLHVTIITTDNDFRGLKNVIVI